MEKRQGKGEARSPNTLRWRVLKNPGQQKPSPEGWIRFCLVKVEADANQKAQELARGVMFGEKLQWMLKLGRLVSSQRAMNALPRNPAFTPQEIKHYWTIWKGIVKILCGVSLSPGGDEQRTEARLRSITSANPAEWVPSTNPVLCKSQQPPQSNSWVSLPQGHITWKQGNEPVGGLRGRRRGRGDPNHQAALPLVSEKEKIKSDERSPFTSIYLWELGQDKGAVPGELTMVEHLPSFSCAPGPKDSVRNTSRCLTHTKCDLAFNVFSNSTATKQITEW